MLAGTIIFLRLLCVDRLAIPCRSGPCVTGQGLLHSKAVISFLRKLTFPVTGFQNKLREGYRSKNAGLLHISSEESTDLLDHIRIGEILKCCCLQALLRNRRFAELLGNLVCQLAKSGIKPVSRAGLVGEPSVDRDNHFIRLRRITQSLILIPKPQQFLFAVAFTDIHAEFDQLVIDLAVHGIGFFRIRRAFDRHSSLIISVAGSTPRSVLLLHVKPHTAILVDTVVAGSLCRGSGKPAAKAFCSTLAHNTVWRDTVDLMRPLPGMIR